MVSIVRREEKVVGTGRCHNHMLEAFYDNWGGFNFVSQNFYNTKVLGVDIVSLCEIFFPLKYVPRVVAILIEHPIDSTHLNITT